MNTDWQEYLINFFLYFYKGKTVHFSNYILCNPDIQCDLLEKIIKNDININFVRKDELIHIISINPNITIELILKYPIDWDWYQLSSTVPIEYIINYPHFPWEWSRISANPSININFIIEHFNEQLDWDCISSNKGIMFKDIIDNLDLPWHWDNISLNPNITFNDVINNLNYNWNFENLCGHPNFTIQNILQLIDINELTEEHINNLSLNPNITPDIIEKYPNIRWSYLNLSLNPSITLDYILKTFDNEWEWNYLPFNPNIDFIMIPGINYKLYSYYYNHNLLFKFLIHHKREINNCAFNFIKQKKSFYNYKFLLMVYNYNFPNEICEYIYKYILG
jgi:hypothetical protein